MAVSNVDYYLNRIRSKVTSVAAQVSNALPGNPVTRDHEVFLQVASAGPMLSWKVYSAQKRSTKKPVSVWLFEKKDLEKWPRYERELFAEILKKGVSQLTRLRHPRILLIEHPLEESRDSYVFCTEPVFASLANTLGQTANITSVPNHLSNFELLDIEIRYGLYQVAEALSFLHIDARMMHRNISPESIIINEKGEWKLAGFDFAVQGIQGISGQVTYEMSEWNESTITATQPLLDYLAPEYVIGGRCDPYSDMFSLGILAVTVFNKGKQPFDNKNSLDTFRKNANKLKSLPSSFFENIPAEFRDDLKMCLNLTPDLRPDATQFSKIVYFDEPLVRTMKCIDSLCQMDNTQKMSFFKQLPQFVSRFPKRPLLQKILPQICAEFAIVELIPFILPSVFHVVEMGTSDDFATVILPLLVPIFPLERPYQIPLLLLQSMDILLQKTGEDDARRCLLPLICNALSSDTVRIQELCLSVLPKVVNMIEKQSMKTTVIPKLLKLVTDGGGMLTIRVQALLCIGKLLPNLESWMVSDQILPALPKVNSREPAILMAALGIYKLAYDDSRLGIAREQCAKSVLPFLISASMENTLNMKQFEQYMALIHRILEKIEKEQRQRLQQLSASQEEQRCVAELANALDQDGRNKFTAVDALESLKIQSDNASSEIRSTGPLSLADKKKLAAEQEQNMRMRNQPNLLQPTNISKGTAGARSLFTSTTQSHSTPFDMLDDLGTCKTNVATPAITPTFSTNLNLDEFLNPSSFYQDDTRAIANPTFSSAHSSTVPLQDVNKPTLNFLASSVNFPSPPAASNLVIRNGFGRGANLSTSNSVSKKTNMSALDDIICFPNKNPKINAPLNSFSVLNKKPLNNKETNKDPFDIVFG